jgi:ribosomal protein L1
MIAARRGDHAARLGIDLVQPVEVYESAANLECAGRRMVFVFDPHAAPASPAQLGPRVLGRRGHHPMNEPGGVLQLGHIEGNFRR